MTPDSVVLTLAQAAPMNFGGAGSPLWIVIAAFILLLLIVPAVSLWLWFWYHRRGGAGSQPGGQNACGACGYPVRGLSSFTCPECGADLRDVGIVTRRGVPRMAIRLWNAMIWCAMWIGLMSGYAGIMILLFDGPGSEQYIMPGMVWSFIAMGIGLLFMFRPQANLSPSIDPSLMVTDDLQVSNQPSTTVTRNLSIMFIDIEGYTGKAASASRDGVIALIRRAREQVQPQIARHRGRIIKTMGDGLLITFDSPTNAVLCGRDTQAEAARRLGTDNEKALRFRIGITTGEVALEDDDVYGDPVNLAARLQQLAAPGEVFFSEATYHAMTKSEVPHESAGEFEVKGMSAKVRVYKAT